MSKHQRRTTACICTAPVSQGVYLCDNCTDELDTILRDLNALALALDSAYLRAQRFSVTSLGIRDPDEAALPFQARAGRLRRELSRELLTLVLIVSPHERLGYHHSYDPTLPYPTTPALAEIVRDRLGWLRTHPCGVDAYRKFTSLHRRILRAVDRPPDLVYLGLCSILTNGVECPADLYAVWGEDHATCRTCKWTHRVDDRRTVLLLAVRDQLATASDISRGLAGLDMRVTAERIRQWKTRKRLVERGEDKRKNPLYRVGDVIDLVLDAERNEQNEREGKPA